MKKSLSLLLAFAMVFSMFASVALAADAELTAQQKYDALKEAGIFAGYEDGTAGLDKEMTRAQFARVAGLLSGLDVDASVTASSFTDVPVTHWAVEEIEAAVAAGLLVGKGDGKYDPQGNITVQQLAVVVAKILGLTPVEDASVEGADAWAAGSVQALINAGVVLPTNYTDNATRGLLVEAAYTVAQVTNPGAANGFVAAATGAKKITVTFNGAVDDSKVKVSLLNGSNQVNTKSTTFADDKKSVVLEFANNLAAADYTVKVEGLTTEALTQALKVEAQKVVKIEFTSDKAPLARGDNNTVTVGYNVLNQYGEKVNGESVSATSSKGTATPINGEVTINSPSSVFILDEKVAVSLVHANGTFATTTASVATVAQVASVDIVALKHADNKTLQAGAQANEFYLELDLKDQYGNSVTSNTYLNNGTDVIVSVTNTAAASVNGFNGTNNTAAFTTKDNKLALELAGTLTAGTSSVIIISKTTGAKDSIDLVVKESVKVDTITLTAPSVAVAGETITIPFTAIDQFGETIANPTNAQLTSRDASGTANDPYFEKDHVAGTTNLKLSLNDVTDKATVIVTIITGTNKVQQLTLSVVAPAVPTVISGTKNFDRNVLKDGSVTVGKGNIVVQDQYGRDKTPTWAGATPVAGEFQVVVESSSANVTSSSTVVNDITSTILAGVNKGSATITLKLQKHNGTAWVDVANSSYSFAQKVVGKDQIVSYDATIGGKVLIGAAEGTHGKALAVKGTLEDGTTVTVTNSTYNYTVDTTNLPAEVVYNAANGKFSTTALNEIVLDKNEATVNVVVIIKGQNGQEVKTVALAVSDAVAKVETLAVETSGIAKKESDSVISVTQSDANGNTLQTLVNDAIKSKDQYGADFADAYVPYDSNYSNSARQSMATVIAGDTFSVTVVAGGKTLTLKVIVK